MLIIFLLLKIKILNWVYLFDGRIQNPIQINLILTLGTTLIQHSLLIHNAYVYTVFAFIFHSIDDIPDTCTTCSTIPSLQDLKKNPSQKIKDSVLSLLVSSVKDELQKPR